MPKTKKSSAPERLRLSIDMDPKAKDKLDELCTKTETKTYAELFRKSIALFSAVVETHRAEGKTVFHYKDGRQEGLQIDLLLA